MLFVGVAGDLTALFGLHPLLLDGFLAGDALDESEERGDGLRRDEFPLAGGDSRVVGRFMLGEEEEMGVKPRPPGDLERGLGDPGIERLLAVGCGEER